MRRKGEEKLQMGTIRRGRERRVGKKPHARRKGKGPGSSKGGGGM